LRSSRDLDRDQLQGQLQTAEYQTLLRFLQRDTPFLRQFSTWTDILAFMRTGTSRDLRKDEVLRPILESHAKDEDPRLRAILLAIFWPGLESIHYQKRDYDPDQEDRWQDIVWIFLQVLCRIDVEQRPSRLVQKIFNDTVHRLHDMYRSTAARTGQEIPFEQEEIEYLAGGREDGAFAAFELREEKEPEIRQLRTHLDAGRLSESDFLLLVGTEVYGLSVANTARLAGLEYELAAKRRQRALANIRRFMEKAHRDS